MIALAGKGANMAGVVLVTVRPCRPGYSILPSHNLKPVCFVCFIDSLIAVIVAAWLPFGSSKAASRAFRPQGFPNELAAHPDSGIIRLRRLVAHQIGHRRFCQCESDFFHRNGICANREESRSGKCKCWNGGNSISANKINRLEGWQSGLTHLTRNHPHNLWTKLDNFRLYLSGFSNSAKPKWTQLAVFCLFVQRAGCNMGCNEKSLMIAGNS